MCERYVYMHMKENTMFGHQADIREQIEEMLYLRLGFYPSLQESTDDNEFEVYLHSDSYEDLEEEQIEQLESLGITEDQTQTTESIKKLLNIEFELGQAFR